MEAPPFARRFSARSSTAVTQGPEGSAALCTHRVRPAGRKQALVLDRARVSGDILAEGADRIMPTPAGHQALGTSFKAVRIEPQSEF
jgi:hypothetical protein